MLVNVVRSYNGYLNEPIIATDTDGIDFTAQTMHYWSSGYCDPIEPTGMAPKYRIQETEIPEWLIDGLNLMKETTGKWPETDAQLIAAKLIYNEMPREKTPEESALQELTHRTNGKFYLSLQTWYQTHGWLSQKQINAILRYNRY